VIDSYIYIYIPRSCFYKKNTKKETRNKVRSPRRKHGGSRQLAAALPRSAREQRHPWPERCASRLPWIGPPLPGSTATTEGESWHLFPNPLLLLLPFLVGIYATCSLDGSIPVRGWGRADRWALLDTEYDQSQESTRHCRYTFDYLFAQQITSVLVHLCSEFTRSISTLDELVLTGIVPARNWASPYVLVRL
jgi:hypothetical protein